MNKKLMLTVLCVSALAFAVFALAGRGQTAQSAQQSASVPDQIAYRHLFSHAAAFKKQAVKQNKRAKTAGLSALSSNARRH